MTPERWRDIQRVLERALERPAAERAAVVSRECGADAALRDEVLSLLAFDGGEDDLLSRPAAEHLAGELDEDGPAPGTTLGPYRLVEALGSGGMGDVYLAEDTRLGRKVAVKLLAGHLAADGRSRARFLREARLAAGLDHPNVCAIHEVGESAQLGEGVDQRRAGDRRRQLRRAEPALDLLRQLRSGRLLLDELRPQLVDAAS